MTPHHAAVAALACAAGLAAGCSGPDGLAIRFDRLDADASGYVDADEYYYGYAPAGYYGAFDADGDGLLTPGEYTAGLATYPLADDDAFGTFDADGDGFLSDREFYGGAFALFDADGDGLLTAEELDASREAFD